jgi:hypothetical protein
MQVWREEKTRLYTSAGWGVPGTFLLILTECRKQSKKKEVTRDALPKMERRRPGFSFPERLHDFSLIIIPTCRPGS